jgi:hypothetical protein
VGSGLLAGATAVAIYTAGPQLWLNGTVAPAQWRMYEVVHGGMAVAGVVSLLALVVVVGMSVKWLLGPSEPALVLSTDGLDGSEVGCPVPWDAVTALRRERFRGDRLVVVLSDPEAALRTIPKAERTVARENLREHDSPVVVDLRRVRGRRARVVAAMEQHSGVTCTLVEREDAGRRALDRERLGLLAVVGAVALVTAGCVAVTVLEWSSVLAHGWLVEAGGGRRKLHETTLELALGPAALAVLSGTLGWRVGRTL